MRSVTEGESEFAPQVSQPMDAEVFVKMQGYLAVGARSEPVSRSLELLPDPLEVIELAVDHDPLRFVLVGDGLIPGGEVDNAEPRMTQSSEPVGREPGALTVGPAMVERGHSVSKGIRRDRLPTRVDGRYAAHEERTSNVKKIGTSRQQSMAGCSLVGTRHDLNRALGNRLPNRGSDNYADSIKG